MKHKSFPLINFKSIDEAEGVFEAIVAVFGNIDRIGDMILKGAFANSLKEWQSKGRPIPVVFSHEWHNLDALIGEVITAKEVDEGLYVKAQLDLEEGFASRVWKKLKKGTLAEFSFAYDTIRSARVDRGEDASPRYITELRELELLEVGPCLFGMNSDTRLLDVKDALKLLLKEMDDDEKASNADGDNDDPKDDASDGKSIGGLSAELQRVRIDIDLLEI